MRGGRLTVGSRRPRWKADAGPQPRGASASAASKLGLPGLLRRPRPRVWAACVWSTRPAIRRGSAERSASSEHGPAPAGRALPAAFEERPRRSMRRALPAGRLGRWLRDSRPVRVVSCNLRAGWPGRKKRYSRFSAALERPLFAARRVARRPKAGPPTPPPCVGSTPVASFHLPSVGAPARPAQADCGRGAPRERQAAARVVRAPPPRRDPSPRPLPEGRGATRAPRQPPTSARASARLQWPRRSAAAHACACWDRRRYMRLCARSGHVRRPPRATPARHSRVETPRRRAIDQPAEQPDSSARRARRRPSARSRGRPGKCGRAGSRTRGRSRSRPGSAARRPARAQTALLLQRPQR
jgi:hypothetical protein